MASHRDAAPDQMYDRAHLHLARTARGARAPLSLPRSVTSTAFLAAAPRGGPTEGMSAACANGACADSHLAWKRGSSAAANARGPAVYQVQAEAFSGNEAWAKNPRPLARGGATHESYADRHLMGAPARHSSLIRPTAPRYM